MPSLPPIIDELSLDFGERVRVVKLDVYEHMGPAMKHHVSTIPTMIVFKNGEVQDRRQGAASKEMIQDWLESYLGQES